VPVGRSFFTPPRGEVVQLGDGLEMWYGIFQSAILGWKPFVNIDGKWVVTLYWNWQYTSAHILCALQIIYYIFL